MNGDINHSSDQHENTCTSMIKTLACTPFGKLILVCIVITAALIIGIALPLLTKGKQISDINL